MNISEFFWATSLTQERRQEICDWVSSLPKDQQIMIEELRFDALEDAAFDANSDENY